MSARRRPALVTLATLLWSLPVGAAEAPGIEDYLTWDWYRTEILIFERPAVQDFRLPEALARRDGRRSFPADMRSLEDAPAPDTGPLDAAGTDAELLAAPSPFLGDARTLDCLPWEPMAAPLTPADMPRLLADIERAMAREEAAAEADRGILAGPGAAAPPAVDPDEAIDGSVAPLPQETPSDGTGVAAAAAAGDDGVGAAEDALFEPDPTLLAETADASEPLAAPDTAAPPDPRERFLQQVADWEAQQLASSYRWLDAQTLRLSPHANRLARGGAHRILLHGAWQQPVPARDAPEPILLLAGAPLPADLYGPPVLPLQGTVSVTLGRFLHVAARLWLHEPAATLAPEALLRPFSGHGELAGRLAQALEPRYFELDESRRLRSEELHYLDHPRFGVLVQVLPVEPPAELEAALAALDAPQG